MTGLIIMLLALWLACEICACDLAQSEPRDPFRRDRWREGRSATPSPEDIERD